MALAQKKAITLTGQSKVVVNDQEVIAQQFTATIVEGTATSTNAVVVNEDVYNANINTCRADKDAFEAWAREIEDQAKAEEV